MKNGILKIRNIYQLHDGWHISAYELRYNDMLTEGPLTLSLKYKKRRRLVNGKLEIHDLDCPYSGRYFEYIFIPNNPDKLRAWA